jgi:hypothetical protein
MYYIAFGHLLLLLLAVAVSFAVVATFGFP